MSERTPSEPAGYAIKRSVAVWALVAGAGVTFLAVVVMSAAPVPVKTTLVALGGIGLGLELGAGMAVPWRILDPQAEGLVLIDRWGRKHRLVSLGPCFVSPFFIGLRGRGRDGRFISLGLFRGQISDEGFRRLTVSLRDRTTDA